MALVEGCKHTLEITVPLEEVEQETERVVAGIRSKAHIQGFRPGKAPVGIIRQRFQADIRRDVLEKILPRFFRKEAEKEGLEVVGTPNVTDVQYDDGQPLRFTAEFETAPEITLGEYKGLEVGYSEPVVTDEDVEKRIEQIRQRKAEFVNEDPRPLVDGDFAAISLHSQSGPDKPIEEDDLQLEVNGPETVPAFTEALRGMSPGESKEVSVEYPEDYGSETLAGKTVVFRLEVKTVRRKELPEMNDEFAQDLGDFQNLTELREGIRRAITAEREYAAQSKSKVDLVEKMIDAHDFPIPETYIDRQIEANVTQTLAERGIDASKIKLDWRKVRETQLDRAKREVKGSLLLEKISATENIHATNEEVDREVQRQAKQDREPVAAVRKRMEKDGTLPRIAARIQTEKVLQFLFENARKVAVEAPAATEHIEG